MKNIIVAIDFSEISPHLIAKAASIARPLQAKVWLLHIAPPDPDFVGYDTGPQYIRDYLAKEFREEHRKLQDFAHHLQDQNIRAEALMVQGPIADTLMEEARKLEGDLLIIASKSHGFLYESFIGSVFKEVLAVSDIPMLVIPAPKEK